MRNYAYSYIFTPTNYFKMEKLTRKEEDIMRILWKLEKAFVKEVAAEIKGEKLHYNTVSTIIRKLQDKEYVSHNNFGNTHQYYPIISKEQYRSFFMNAVSNRLFNDSYKSMVSFFAEKEKISTTELQEIIDLIEHKKRS